MPNKIRILLFTMIAGAGLIVFSTFIGMQNLSNLRANIGEITGKTNSNQATSTSGPARNANERSDIDKDGLFDEEEPIYRTDPLNPDTDGDGFLDGEEVAAGCSPISASAKDCNLNLGSQTNINLTEYFSSLIIGGILSKDLDAANPKINDYVLALSDEAKKIQKTLLSIDTNLNTEVNRDSSQKASQEYLNNLEDILINHFLKKEGSLKITGDLTDFDYSPYLGDAETTYKEAAELKPPTNWLDLHKKSLEFFSKLRGYYSNLDNQKEDPIKALLTLKQTSQLISDYEDLIREISDKIKKDGLKTEIFNL